MDRNICVAGHSPTLGGCDAPGRTGEMRLSRRRFLTTLSGAASMTLLSPQTSAADAATGSPRVTFHDRYLIVNADDLGADDGINRGIIEAHERGIVTSASLMVNMPSAASAVRTSREHPTLSLGLHANFTAGRRIPDLRDLRALQQELERQFNMFTDMTGQIPTHVDSHHHVHRKFNIVPLFIELCRTHRIPLRGFSEVTYVGKFYGQWDPGKTDVRHISLEYLISLLRNLAPGFSELGCHPGDHGVPFDPVYDWQRRIELEALTDPRLSATVTRDAIRLINYRDYGHLVPRPSAGISASPNSPGSDHSAYRHSA
jgi:predicted glycoside hydrolase/deacetylase ChbG (UPF0249 family)